MARAGGPIEWVIPKRLTPSSVRQAHLIPDPVIKVIRFIDLRTRDRELVQDLGDLGRGIVV